MKDSYFIVKEHNLVFKWGITGYCSSGRLRVNDATGFNTRIQTTVIPRLGVTVETETRLYQKM